MPRETPIGPFVLPEWIDPEIWTEFEAHRKKLKKPMTDFAKKLIVSELDKAREYADPNEELMKSIRRGWLDVYPNKPKAVPAPVETKDEEPLRQGPWARRF